MNYKKLAGFLLGGAILGTFLSAWISPQVISWWFTPPVDLAVTCQAAVEWGIYTYRDVIIGGAIGGMATALVAFLIVKFRTSPKTGPV